eukprot:10457856-Karenia_brevis.AAC.1
MGVYWCENDARNLSCALPGVDQTNQRAELHAVYHVLCNHAEAIDIHTDSKYVFDGCTKNLSVWQTTGYNISNADLWRQ